MTRREFIFGAGSAAAGCAVAAGGPAGARVPRGRAGVVKFCAFADIHYYPKVYPHDTREWLERVLARAETARTDFVIHMGDIAHRPVADRDYLDFYNDFRIKTYHTCGNHDFDRESSEKVLDAFRLSRGYYHFDCKGFRFIVTDTNYCLADGRFLHYSGGNYCALAYKSMEYISRVPPEQLEWLKATIESSPYPCIVTSHASYEREDGSPDRAAVRKIFNDANARHPGRVRLVINGHHHTDFVRILDGIVYLDLNSANFEWFGKTHSAYPAEDFAKWESAPHVITWNDPVSAIITIAADGRLRVEGQNSTFHCGVPPEKAGLPRYQGAGGRLVTPNIQSFEMQMAYPKKKG